MENIKEKVINFIIENEDKILFLGACIIVGGVTAVGSYYLTNKGYVAGYKAGKSVGYCKGIEQGAGNILIDVAIGKVAGCDVDGKTYEFISKETTKEVMFAKDPTLEFCANRYTCTHAEI